MNNLLIALQRHVVPIILTPLVVMCGWLVFGLPLFLVFLIDDTFGISEFIQNAAMVFGVGLAMTLLVSFPLTLLVEKMVVKTEILIIAIAIVLMSILVFGVIIFFTNKDFFYGIDPWGGRILLFAFSFLLYWIIFWVPRFWKRSEK